MASDIYQSILVPNLLLGVPRSWFVISGFGFLVPYFFMNEKIIGFLLLGFLHFVGYMLTKYYDADFANILMMKMQYFDGIKFGRPKVYHD